MSQSVIEYYYLKIINDNFDFKFDYIDKNTAKEIKKEYDNNTNQGSCKKCIERSAQKRLKLRIQNLIISKIKQ